MKKLVIIGIGGFGREVAWLIERINKIQSTWDLIGFVDDDTAMQNSIVDGYPVLGYCNWLLEHKDNIYAVCAIGSAKTRKKVIQKLDGVSFATIIDPSVIISDKVKIGEGCIICAGSILTVNISLGNHVIINLDCTVGHDTILHNFVTLYPSVNVSGNVILNECVEMGTGSQIIQGIEIGENSIVGAGAVVVTTLPQECTAVGIPAKSIKFNK